MVAEAWVATVDGQPVQAFGVIPETLSVLRAWAFGTPNRWPAVPEMTRFVWSMFDRHVLAGITRIEARAIEGHEAAHRWMRRMGASETPLPYWGMNGENFILFSWTQENWAGERGYRAVRRRYADRTDPEWFDHWASERCG